MTQPKLTVEAREPSAAEQSAVNERVRGVCSICLARTFTSEVPAASRAEASTEANAARTRRSCTDDSFTGLVRPLKLRSTPTRLALAGGTPGVEPTGVVALTVVAPEICEGT